MITEIHYADNSEASRKRIMEVYRLLLHPPVKEALERKQQGEENLDEREEPPSGS